MIWDVDLDEMVVDLRTAANLAVESGLMKRHIFSLSGWFYDPIGIITPSGVGTGGAGGASAPPS